MKVLDDPADKVSRMAALSLVELSGKKKPDADSLLALLSGEGKKSKTKSPANGRSGAAYVLGRTGGRKAVEPLMQRLEKEKKTSVKKAVCEALGHLRAEDAVELLGIQVKEGRPALAEAAIRALGHIGMAGAKAVLAGLDSGSLQVRSAAAEVLKELTEEDFGEDADKWRKHLESK